MEVTFAHFGDEIASSRLRAGIPQKALEKLGVKRGTDVLIYGKDWLEPEVLLQFDKKIYDVCDDHFSTPEKATYYREHCLKADAVTCNSEEMRKIIKAETGRDAFVIKEPYESKEREPEISDKLLWFGHSSNLKDLERIKPELKHPLLVLTNNRPEYVEWTPQHFRLAISKPCIVIIPTGKKMAKSENRMVESIRNGRYVCAGYLPAYESFSPFFPIGNIPEHIEEALANPERSIDRIKAAQDYIRDKYSPETIGKQWLEVIKWL